MLAPGVAHCGGGSEFASSVPTRGPGAPLDRAPSGAGGGLPAGRRPGCARGPPQVAGSGSGLEPLHPPPGRDPRRAPTRPNPALFGPNFSGFLPPCGAASRGGGGAPPTTLILLRNQRRGRRPSVSPAPRARRDASGPVLGLAGAKKDRKKRSFFLKVVVCSRFEVGVWQSPAAMWPSVGLAADLPHCGGLRQEGTGGCPQPPPSWRAPRR